MPLIAAALGACSSASLPSNTESEIDALKGLILGDLIRDEGRRPGDPVTAISMADWSDFVDREFDPNDADMNRRKMMSFAAIMEQNPRSAPEGVTRSPKDPRAVSQYASGRLKFSDGKAVDALKDFESALQIDGDSAEIHRAVGECLAAMGRRNESIRSYEKAVLLGLNEASVHRSIAVEHMRAQEWEKAIEDLKSCIQAPDFKTDSDLGVVARADLGTCLAESGYLSAGEFMLSEVADASFATLAAGKFRSELTEVFRKRSDLRLLCGDLALMRKDPSQALNHYRKAAALPSADPLKVRLRIALAHLRAGRPAHAGQLILNQFDDAKLRWDSRLPPAIAALSPIDSIRDEFEEAVRLKTADPAVPFSIRAGILRASAKAAADIEDRRAILRALVASDPADGASTVELLATYIGNDAEDLPSEVESLSQIHPEHADVIASSVLALGLEVRAVINELDGAKEIGPATVCALLLSATGNANRALDLVRSVRSDSALRYRAIAQFSSGLGMQTDAATALESLRATDKASGLARIHALAMLGRNDEVVATSKDLLDQLLSPSETVQLCKLLLECGESKIAESVLLELTRSDMHCEIAYELLVRIYAPGGPLADESKLNQTARTIRQSLGDGRIVKTIQAQDALNRSMWSQADRLFTELLDPYSESPSVLESLVLLWERAAKVEPELTAKGEELLRIRLRERPESALLNLALSRVLIASDRAQEAEALLSGIVETIAYPELRRQRERVMRDHLGMAAEADALSVSRLSEQPASLSTSLEWFDFYAQRGDFETAVSIFSKTLPKHVGIDAQSAVQLIGVLNRITPERVLGKNDGSAEALAELIDRLLSANVKFPPALHVLRLELLARALPRETNRIVRAVADFNSIQPEMKGAATNQVFRWISESSDDHAGLSFLRAIAQEDSDPDLFGFLVQQTCITGTFEDARALIEELKDTKPARTVLNRVDPESIQADSNDAELRAELAYIIALEFAGRDLQSDARSMYRLALQMNPEHGWSANNLGFALLEESGPTEEAARLLELAFSKLPEESSIIDSLAWLRFKQGRILNDDVDGALVLIERAIAGDKEPSAEVLDHAGDINWAAGLPEQAVNHWTAAAAKAESDLLILQQRGITGVRYDHFDRIARRSQAKSAAVRKGDAPDLTP
jgi:tetratricopeptide (TPR) repeat protein